MFKKKEISRQRRWQIKKVHQGLCSICGENPIYKGGRCRSCYFPWALFKREYERNKHGRNCWRFGKVGRPPVLEMRMQSGEDKEVMG
jgi:hypothetical protein